MNIDNRMKKLLREAVRLSERIDMLRREVYGEDALDVHGEPGVPRPCPKCGAYVEISKGADPAVNEDKFWVECSMYFSVRDCRCRYETSLYDTAEEAWREHEQNCQAAEEEV